MMKMDHVEL